MPRVFLVIVAAAALAGAPAARAAEAASMAAARDAYFQMRVPEAEALAGRVAGDAAAPAKDRAEAARMLAKIAWLVDADAARAAAELDRALATGADLCPTVLYETRVLREAGRGEAAGAFASQHAGDCPGQAQGDGLLTERAKAGLAAAAAASGAGRTAALGAARAALAGLSPRGALTQDAARAKLGLALMSSDGRAALDAWRGFYWLTDRNAPQSFGLADGEVAALFRGALGPRPTLAQEIGLERLLVRGGFLDEALAFDAARRIGPRAAGAPAYRPVAAYFAFRQRFDAATLGFDRANARGHGDALAYAAEVKTALSEASAALGGGDPAAVLGAELGLRWMQGLTGGVMSVHLGHVVEDNRYQVSQFDRRGEVRFVSIDNLASNGFQSWLWDGLAQTGGWSENGGEIVQIRSAYTSGPLRALASFDPQLAAKQADDLRAAEARDAAVLKGAAATAFLPGLQARLARQARDQLAVAARAESARTGEPFERTFLKVYWDAEVGHSIYIHEGRHALDHASYTGAATLPSAELEFRAKLAEIELARFPRMPLAAVLSADIGDQTPHGVADARIMAGLSQWITAHAGEVAGFDPALAAAEQIDKLSDEQMRAIARSLDPQLQAPRTSAQAG